MVIHTTFLELAFYELCQSTFIEITVFYQPGQAKRRARVKALCMFVCAANHNIHLCNLATRRSCAESSLYFNLSAVNEEWDKVATKEHPRMLNKTKVVYYRMAPLNIRIWLCVM